MAYSYTGPSLAAGGRLVKKGQRAKRQAIDPGEMTVLERARKRAKDNDHLPNGDRDLFDPAAWAERLAPGWDARGWHGGGMCKIRKTIKSRPSKGNSRTGRQAHPSLLRVTK